MGTARGSARRLTRRAAPAAILTTLAASAAAGSLATTPLSASPTTTRVLYVAPVDRSGRPLSADVVTETTTGSCEAGSDVVTGPVYRCGAGPGPGNRQGGIADPCMAAVYGRTPTRTVLCMLEPWSHDLLRIVTKGLPTSSAPFSRSRAFPLGVQLTTGQRCLAAQGAHDRFHGRVVDYYCTGHPGRVLLGGSRRSRQPWSFDSASETTTGYRAAAPADVAIAWFEGWAPTTG